jgi:putative transposase
VIEWRGKPRMISCDNGPEYISGVMAQWAKKHDIEIAFIQPGQSQQNAYIERYNRTLRYDWLAQHLFESLDEIQGFTTGWLWTYNHERPNMGLGGITQNRSLRSPPNPYFWCASKMGGLPFKRSTPRRSRLRLHTAAKV